MGNGGGDGDGDGDGNGGIGGDDDGDGCANVRSITKGRSRLANSSGFTTEGELLSNFQCIASAESSDCVQNISDACFVCLL